MAQTQEVRGTKTSVCTVNGVTKVQYHDTVVVEFDADTITLRDGGWHVGFRGEPVRLTATTKLRMNQAASQFDLGYGVYAKRGQWYVDYRGETLEYEDGMVLQRN